LLDPDAQDVLDPGHIDAHGDVSGLVAGVAAVFDLDDDRVEVYHRVDRVQWPALPGQDLLRDLVDDLGDRLVRNVGPDRRRKVKLYVTQGHSTGIQGDDHVIEPAEATGALGHQPRSERAVTITRHIQRHRAGLGLHRLGRSAIAGIGQRPPHRVAL